MGFFLSFYVFWFVIFYLLFKLCVPVAFKSKQGF
jgi:hypothetical protein